MTLGLHYIFGFRQGREFYESMTGSDAMRSFQRWKDYRNPAIKSTLISNLKNAVDQNLQRSFLVA